MPNEKPDNLTPTVTFVEDEQSVDLHDATLEPPDGAVNIPDELPILPLRGLVVYPQTAIPLNMGQPRSVRLVDEDVAVDGLIGLVAAKNPEQETPGPDKIYEIGTLAAIHRLFRAPDGTIRLLVQGMARIRVDTYTNSEPYLKAKVSAAPEVVDTSIEVEALMRNVIDQF